MVSVFDELINGQAIMHHSRHRLTASVAYMPIRPRTRQPMTNKLALLVRWWVRQKPDGISSVLFSSFHLRRSVHVLNFPEASRNVGYRWWRAPFSNRKKPRLQRSSACSERHALQQCKTHVPCVTLPASVKPVFQDISLGAASIPWPQRPLFVFDVSVKKTRRFLLQRLVTRPVVTMNSWTTRWQTAET